MLSRALHNVLPPATVPLGTPRELQLPQEVFVLDKVIPEATLFYQASVQEIPEMPPVDSPIPQLSARQKQGVALPARTVTSPCSIKTNNS
jgi:hypothetical protein